MDEDFDQPSHEELAVDIGHLGDSGWVDGSQPEENSDWLERKCYRDQFQGTYWSLTRLQVWRERLGGRTLILCHDGRCDVPDGTSAIDHQERGDPDNPPPSSDSAGSSVSSAGSDQHAAADPSGGYQDG